MGVGFLLCHHGSFCRGSYCNALYRMLDKLYVSGFCVRSRMRKTKCAPFGGFMTFQQLHLLRINTMIVFIVTLIQGELWLRRGTRMNCAFKESVLWVFLLKLVFFLSEPWPDCGRNPLEPHTKPPLIFVTNVYGWKCVNIWSLSPIGSLLNAIFLTGFNVLSVACPYLLSTVTHPEITWEYSTSSDESDSLMKELAWILYYIADTQVTRLTAPYCCIRQYSRSLRFAPVTYIIVRPYGSHLTHSAHGILNCDSHNKIISTYNISWGLRCYIFTWECWIIVMFKICDLQVKTIPMMYHL